MELYTIHRMLVQLQQVLGVSSEITFTLQEHKMYVRVTAFRGRRLNKVITIDTRQVPTDAIRTFKGDWEKVLHDLKLGLELLGEANSL